MKVRRAEDKHYNQQVLSFDESEQLRWLLYGKFRHRVQPFPEPGTSSRKIVEWHRDCGVYIREEYTRLACDPAQARKIIKNPKKFLNGKLT